MSLVIEVDTAADEPPYEQVRRQVAALVAAGELAAGEKLPTVRQLATDLGLAANTVARAYRELESGGVVATHGRRGTFVSSSVLGDRQAPPSAAGERASAAAEEYVGLARRTGLSLPEAVRLVEARWGGA